MSAPFSIADAEKKIEELSLPLFVKDSISNSRRSMHQLNFLISKNENDISQQIQRRNVNIPLL